MTMIRQLDKTLSIDGIPITLTRKKVKNINLRVSSKSGAVSVSAPKSVPEAFIVSFIKSKIEWISERHQAGKNAQPERLLNYQNDDELPFLGERHILKVNTNKRASVQLIQNRITNETHIQLNCPEHSTREQRESIIKQWYRAELNDRLPAMFAKWCSALDINIHEYRIKKMKTKWGTCNIQDRRIWLNLALIEYPQACIEYVVLHELAHLFERYHNARFYAIIEKHMPDWREWEAHLNRA